MDWIIIIVTVALMIVQTVMKSKKASREKALREKMQSSRDRSPSELPEEPSEEVRTFPEDEDDPFAFLLRKLEAGQETPESDTLPVEEPAEQSAEQSAERPEERPVEQPKAQSVRETAEKPLPGSIYESEISDLHSEKSKKDLKISGKEMILHSEILKTKF